MGRFPLFDDTPVPGGRHGHPWPSMARAWRVARLVERHGGIGSHLEANDVGDLGPVPLPEPRIHQRMEQRDVLLEPIDGPKSWPIKGKKHAGWPVFFHEIYL